MKKIKTFVTMLAAVAALILLPGVFTLKAAAAEPTTFYIDYDPDGYGWYVLVEADMANRDSAPPKVMQVFYNFAKDGDIVVVSNYHDNAPQLDLGNIRLGNVTVLQNTNFTMIKAAYIYDFFALSNSFCSISAPVNNAYVYDPAVVNFNDNVKNILVNVDSGISTSSIGCNGTVESLKVLFTTNNTSYSLYDFKKDTFRFSDGVITTPPYLFSTVPVINTPAQLPVATTTIPTLKDVFDEHYYADKYPDLKAAFGYNREALWTHYITNGINEFRSMNSLLNVTNYRYQYTDLNVAFGDNWDAYLAHYITSGAQEGRNSGTEFNAIEYADRYSDLKALYGYDVMALWQHYKTTWTTEGRDS